MEETNGNRKIAAVGAGPDHCKHLGFALRGQGSLERSDPGEVRDLSLCLSVHVHLHVCVVYGECVW